jgi:hypothetical protein
MDQDTVSSRHANKKAQLWAVVVIIIIIIVIGTFLLAAQARRHMQSSLVNSAVPYGIRQRVDFTIYYPDNNKMPAGYRYNPSTLHATKNAADYAIDKDGTQLFAVTIQSKPSAAALQTFYTHNLPLSTIIVTPIGTANVGTINLQSVISLPTNGNSWLILTTPQPIQTATLTKILNAMTPAN